MKPLDEAKLKIELAKQLPDLISITSEDLIEVDEVKGSNFYFTWKDTGKGVTEREWDWIVRRVVGGLSVKQFATFVSLLKGGNSLMARNAQFLTWQQRGFACLQAQNLND